MKIITISNNFKRKMRKLDSKLISIINEKTEIFKHDEFDPRLNNHKLAGDYINCRSINVTSDVRIIYRKTSPNFYIFTAIGTHSELYS